MIRLNKKAIVAAIVAILTIAFCVTPVFAAKTINGVTINPNTSGVKQEVRDAGNKVLGYIQVVGTFIAVGVLMYLGIKYMTASANEKADVKKSIIPYIIGCVVLLAAVNIVPLVSSIGATLFGN